MAQDRFLFLCSALLLGACASAPEQKPLASASPASNPFCLRETGSRIEGHCVMGQTVEQEELQRTGAGSLGEALRKRVPALGSGL